MYLLALAFLLASAYSFWVGEVSNARSLVGVAVVLAGARFFLGPQQEASAVRRVGAGIAVLVLAALVVYATNRFFG